MRTIDEGIILRSAIDFFGRENLITALAITAIAMVAVGMPTSESPILGGVAIAVFVAVIGAYQLPIAITTVVREDGFRVFSYGVPRRFVRWSQVTRVELTECTIVATVGTRVSVLSNARCRSVSDVQRAGGVIRRHVADVF